MKILGLLGTVALVAVGSPLAAQNQINGQSPDAPELAAYGDLTVGVSQIELVNKDQIDILSIDPAGDPTAPLPIYDRPLTVEVWYPAAAGSTGETSFNAYLRDGITEVTLNGSAVRDAAPIAGSEPFPLLVLSHGYPGNRFLMSHLAENLASKGYVVASIDHTDSTYRTRDVFGSTLVNRPIDQLFVLEELARLSNDSRSPFSGLIDTDNSAILGYSMGGYGALIAGGAGVTETSVGYPWGGPLGTLGVHQAGSETHEALPDPRVKTMVTIGPWGMNAGFWDAEGLAGIDIPTLFIAGSDDSISQYETGVRAIWEGATNADRALLTFLGGGHSVAAPIPAPEESFYFSDVLGFNVSEHYNDPVWDQLFSNNVAQHFLTAWLDYYLKGDESKAPYLDISGYGSNGDWLGFAEGTSDGLKYEYLAAVPLPASVWMLGLAVAGLGVMRKSRARRA